MTLEKDHCTCVHTGELCMVICSCRGGVLPTECVCVGGGGGGEGGIPTFWGCIIPYPSFPDEVTNPIKSILL